MFPKKGSDQLYQQKKNKQGISKLRGKRSTFSFVKLIYKNIQYISLLLSLVRQTDMVKSSSPGGGVQSRVNGADEGNRSRVSGAAEQSRDWERTIILLK